jgi:DNA modification methylase
MYKIYNDDCLKIMDNLISENIKFDAIITDPPYGTTNCRWDSIIKFPEMWKRLKLLRNKNTPIILFGDEPFSSYLRISNIKEYRYDWIWEKNKCANFFQAYKQPLKNIENICVFYKSQCHYTPLKHKSENKKSMITKGNKYQYDNADGDYEIIQNAKKLIIKNSNNYNIDENLPDRLLVFPVDIKNRVHPTQKPIALLEYIIETYTKETDLVLDFTMGSGSAGVACRNLNRNFYGIEKNKNYFDIAKHRIENSRNIFDD